MSWSRALAILATITHWFAGSVGGQAISVEAGALIGRHTASKGATGLAFRLAVLTSLRLKRVSLAALALIPLVAHSVAAAQGTGGDALALGGANVAGHADTGIRSSADSIPAVIRADRLTAAVDVRISLIAIAADLDATHVRSGAIANELIPRIAEQ